MEKFKKFISILEKGLNALYIAFLVMSIVMVCFAVIGLVWDTSLIGEVDTYINLGMLKLEVAEDSIVTENVSLSLIVVAVVTAVQFGLACVLAKLLQKIIAPMKDGTLFVDTVHQGLKKLSIYVLVSGFINSLAEVVGSIMVYKAYNFDMLFNPENVLKYSIDIQDNGDFVVFAAVLFLLSYVFKYGAELQNQVDETL